MSQIVLEDISGGSAYSLPELMTTTLAHYLRDGEVVGTGGGLALARAACRLAQLTHAPNLNYVAGGSGAVNSELAPLVASSGDYTNLICEAVVPMSDWLDNLTRGGLNTFIASGLQIDKYGNVNQSLLGDPANPSLRGSGGALLPLLTAARRIIYCLPNHSPRTFVPKLDFRTAPGFLDGPASWLKAKADGLYTGGGPALVISNLGVMDFDPETKVMRLIAVHPGVTLQQLQAATGFELVIPPKGAYTPVPTQRELEILREMDENGLLRSTQ